MFISCSNAVQIEFESFLANKLPVLVKDDTMHKLIDLWAKRWFDRYSCNSTSYTAAVATRVSRNVFKDVASELAPDGKKRTKAVNNYLKNIVAPAELEARDQTLLFLFSFRAALYVNMRMVEFVTEVIIESRLDSYFDINRILNYHLCEVYEKNNGAFF